MNMAKFVKLIPAVGMVCMISLPALAQTATSGTMTPVAANTTKVESHKHEHKKHESKTKDEGKKASALPASARFSSVGEATAHCGSGNVEWATMGGSKVYHDSKSRYFGKTKHGAYACKSTLDAAGFHLGK